MRQHFSTLDVTRSLGVAPSTGAIIAGLLNGEVNPDNCRSIEYWPFADFGAPPQHEKVMAAIASLLELSTEDVLKLSSPGTRGGFYLRYQENQPTVIWTGVKFLLGTVKRAA